MTLFDGHDELYHHAKFGKDRTTRAGCRCENVVFVFFCYRKDAAKRQTAGIVFTHRPKIRFFAPQGRLVAPIQVKLCSTDWHRGPLGCAKFRPQFSNLVAPSTDGSAKCLVHYKGHLLPVCIVLRGTTLNFQKSFLSICIQEGL